MHAAVCLATAWLVVVGLSGSVAEAFVVRGRGGTTRTSRLWNKASEAEVREQLRKSREEAEVAAGDDLRNRGQQLIDGFDADEVLMQRLKSKRSYASILVERFMQSIDDYQLSEKTKEYKELAVNDPLYYELKMRAATGGGGGGGGRTSSSKRERIVVLGTGWGGHSFLKTVDATQYEVTVISPRNFFLFTPMLAASSVGTVEFRSICEPIRNVNPLVDYLEASALGIDSAKKVVQCQSVKCVGTACEINDFEVSYDYLVVAVGAATNTFGIKGVRENCLFLKQIEDAAKLRKAIAYCFERANIPDQTDEQKRDALSFVVVGAGPTGVEFTGELRDWLENEGRRYYPKLLKYASLKLIEAGNAVLAVFDKTLQDEALVQLTQRESRLVKEGLIDKEMTTVLLQAGVKEVGEKYIELSSGEKMPYGFCVWAAGNGPLPLVLDAVNQIEQQKQIQAKARGRLATDGWLRALGAPGVYAIGDCAFQEESPMPATAQVASQQGAYLGRLFSKGFDMSTPAPLPPAKFSIESDEGFASEKYNVGALGVRVDPPIVLNEPESATAVATATAAAAASATTAAEAASASAVIVSAPSPAAAVRRRELAKPFQFLNLGVLAYIGASKALAQISVDEKLVLGSGPLGFLLWRGIYWSKQVSWRNRALVGIDWIKARLFGRDINNL